MNLKLDGKKPCKNSFGVLLLVLYSDTPILDTFILAIHRMKLRMVGTVLSLVFLFVCKEFVLGMLLCQDYKLMSIEVIAWLTN